MKKRKNKELDFEVDRLSESILNAISGDSFQTVVSIFTTDDLKQITRKKGWNFDWKSELSSNTREVYKLTISNSPNIVVQGLLSISFETNLVYMNLLESAPFNIGTHKLYEGVAGNLAAYACKLSFQRGDNGYVGFVAKTKLISHY